RTPPGSPGGTVITEVSGGCTHPGTRLARFRLTNSVPFLANARPKFIWSSSVGSNRTNSVVQAYIPPFTPPGTAFVLTGGHNNVNYDDAGTCDQNNRLNAVCSNQPTANAGSNITTCGDAHLNGSFGGGATTATWSSPTGG